MILILHLTNDNQMDIWYNVINHFLRVSRFKTWPSYWYPY